MILSGPTQDFRALNPNVQWPEVILYKDDNFGGGTLGSIFMATDLIIAQGPGGPVWWKETSSIAVVSGVWEFFRAGEFQGPALRLGPGRYPSVSAAANDPKWNDAILSLRYVSI
jgi:hypothetical protein